MPPNTGIKIEFLPLSLDPVVKGSRAERADACRMSRMIPFNDTERFRERVDLNYQKINQVVFMSAYWVLIESLLC